MNGEIDRVLAGRRVRHCYTDGGALVVETECGHWARIIWQDEPTLDRCDVKIILPPARIVGSGASI